jgi:hypothetical protein
VQVGTVTAVAWPKEMPLALALAERAEEPVEWPGLGRRSPEPLRLIVVPNARQLAAVSSGRAPRWGAAVAFPGSRTIMLRADGGDVPGALRHELAHLALHEAIRGRVPLWFDEGYAAWAAGEWTRLDAISLNFAVMRGRVPDLSQLDGGLRGSAADADLSYALAASAVLELSLRHPDRSIAPLMGRLESGVPFEDAVRQTTGLTMGQFEREWQRAVRRRYGLLTWLLAGGAWMLFALGLGAAVWWRRRADRPRRAALDVGWELPPDDDVAPAGELDPTPKS